MPTRSFFKMPGLRQGGSYTLRIVPSGYEFLGPGNKVLYQVPRNHNDAIAKAHDIAYGRLQEKGINPYITFNKADQAFLQDLQPDDLPTFFANYAFKGKEWLASVGILPTGTSFYNSPWSSGLIQRYKTRTANGCIRKSQLIWMVVSQTTRAMEINLWISLVQPSEVQTKRVSLPITTASAQPVRWKLRWQPIRRMREVH